jgi:PAS domain S-box-containing protein
MLGSLPAGVVVIGFVAGCAAGWYVAIRRRRVGTRAIEPRLRAMNELVADAIVIMNGAGEIVSWNSGATSMFGRDASEALGSTIWPMMPEGYEAQYGGFFVALADGSLAPPRRPVEIVSMHRDGSSLPTELSVSTWREGDEGYVLCIFRDVSERRRMEAELRASTELFHGVLEGASETAIVATDEQGVITVFNRGAQLLLGYDEAEARGLFDLTRFHDPEELAARAVDLGVDGGFEALVCAARRGEAETREWSYACKNGDRIPVSLTVTAMTHDEELCGFIAVARDLTAQRRAEKRVEYGNEAFRVAFDSAPVAVLLTKADVTCAHASPAFCELTGYTIRELMNMSMLDLIVDDDDNTHEEILETENANFASVLQGRTLVHHSERRIRRADGTAVWVREHTSMVADDDGGPLLWVTHLEDMTQEQRVQNALREALANKIESLDRLEELDRQKSDFVSMISHELRSPVTSIIGYLELLRDGEYGELPTAQAEALGVVARNAARLEQLIADLMTMSRLETGSRAQLQTAPVDVAKVVENVTSSMQPVLAQRGQPLTVNAVENVGTVSGDERQIEHVVTNLLTNASKFTREGGAIAVDLRRDGDRIVIAVRDAGIGIPREELAKVFKRFYRGGGEVTNIPGTGLGLSIVQAIVRKHGGEVSIESEVGVGTTVTLVFPAEVPDLEPRPMVLQSN